MERHRSIAAVSRVIGVSERAVASRRSNLQSRLGIKLEVGSPGGKRRDVARSPTPRHHPRALNLGIEHGQVLVFSDAHFMPAQRTTMFRGLLKACELVKPKVVIANGDIFDGGHISRHPRSPFWDQNTPNVVQELRACQAAMEEIETAARSANKNVRLVWCRGNHDDRFENRLASVAPEFAGVDGFSIGDHFPEWEQTGSCWLTESVVAMHRHDGGIHAAHNNAVKSGVSIITGHLHSAKVTPWTDLTGTRWGVDTGTLAEPWGIQFGYMEQKSRNWRSAFALLSITDGRLQQPHIALKWDENHMDLCGQIVEVAE